MRGNVPDLDLPTPAEMRHRGGVDLTDLNHKLKHSKVFKAQTSKLHLDHFKQTVHLHQQLKTRDISTVYGTECRMRKCVITYATARFFVQHLQLKCEQIHSSNFRAPRKKEKYEHSDKKTHCLCFLQHQDKCKNVVGSDGFPFVLTDLVKKRVSGIDLSPPFIYKNDFFKNTKPENIFLRNFQVINKDSTL